MSRKKDKGKKRTNGKGKPQGVTYSESIRNSMNDCWRDGYSRGMVKAQDDICLALGRLGWGQQRIKKLSDTLAEVVRDYQNLAYEDGNTDNDVEYTKGVYDRELKSVLGDYHQPWEKRYDLTIYTDGIRSVQLYEKTHVITEEVEKKLKEKFNGTA